MSTELTEVTFLLDFGVDTEDDESEDEVLVLAFLDDGWTGAATAAGLGRSCWGFFKSIALARNSWDDGDNDDDDDGFFATDLGFAMVMALERDELSSSSLDASTSTTSVVSFFLGILRTRIGTGDGP